MDYPHHELEEHCYRTNAIIAWLQGWSKLEFFWLEDSKDFPVSRGKVDRFFRISFDDLHFLARMGKASIFPGLGKNRSVEEK